MPHIHKEIMVIQFKRFEAGPPILSRLAGSSNVIKWGKLRCPNPGNNFRENRVLPLEFVDGLMRPISRVLPGKIRGRRVLFPAAVPGLSRGSLSWAPGGYCNGIELSIIELQVHTRAVRRTGADSRIR